MRSNDAFRLIEEATALEWLILLAAVAMVLLTAGCGNEEFEHQQKIAEFNAKVTRMCIPDTHSFITVKWEDEGLVFRNYDKWETKLVLTKTVLETE